jgi:hypothetical protein
MTTFAPLELTGRRVDEKAVALYFDAAGPIQVDADHPFTKRTGRRYQAGSLVRLGVLFTPGAAVSAASFSVAMGSVKGTLAYDQGAWSVTSPDAEGDTVTVAEDILREGVEYAVSLTVDVANGLYRDVVVEGAKVAPQVIDLIAGPQLPDEQFIVDILTGGQVDVAMPEWVKDKIRDFDAEQLLAIAREQGGRFEVSRTPEPEVERVPRPAPLGEVDGDPVFTFTVEANGPMTVARAWAVEA